MFRRLADFGQVEGIEPDKEIVSPQGEFRERIHVRAFDDTFNPHRRYGLITVLDVLEHLPQPDRALDHVARLLSPTGLLVLTVPAFRALWTMHDDLNQHQTRYTKASLQRLLEAAGFSIIQARYLFQWICGAKLLIRLREKILPAKPKPPHVPSMPVNKLLYWMTGLEEWAFRHVPIPLGSSLLVLARHTTAAHRSEADSPSDAS